MTESTNTVHVGVPGAATHATNYDVRLVRVESDVAGLKTDIAEISSTMKSGFKDIGAQVAARSQPNWPALALGAAILIPGLGWAWSQIGNLQTHLEAATGNFVSRADIQDKFNSAKEVADLKAQIAAGKIDRLAADVADIQSKIVPLSTHQELWASQHEANKALAAQIDENRRALADITAPRDTIVRINKRLDDFEDVLRGRAAERRSD